jgi:P4 family phage/plasmid primase-like protien
VVTVVARKALGMLKIQVGIQVGDSGSGRGVLRARRGSDGGSGSGGGNWLDDVPMDDQPDPKGYDCNDIDQARFFLDVFESSVRYIPEIKAWVIYDGMTWHKDEFGSVSYLYNRGCLQPTKKRMLKALSDSQQVLRNNGNNNQDPAFIQLDSVYKNCKKIYEKYGNTNGIRGMLEAAHQKPGVAIKYSQLNHDDTVLAMPNGKVIKLARRGRDEAKNQGSQGFSIIENHKGFYTTMKTANNFRSLSELKASAEGQAQLKLWGDTLRLLLPDKELRLFVQRVFGHMLLGGNDEKKMVFLAGRPHTGKSTLLNSFEVLGDYSGTFNPAALMEDGGTKPNPELIKQWHRRVVHNSESGMSRLDVGMIKKVTGRDQMMCRALNSNNMIEGMVKFTTVIATNKVPTIRGADAAVRNRMLVIPIETVVTRDVDDKSMTTALSERCGDAILLWLLEGYRQYVQLGLDESTWPAIVSGKTEEFNDDLSDVSTFLKECCKKAPEDILNLVGKEKGWDLGISKEKSKELSVWRSIPVARLYVVYLKWLGEETKPLAKNVFSGEVRGLGYPVVPQRINGIPAKVFAGLKFRDDLPPDLKRISIGM